MEVSALKYSGGVGLHGRSALLRLQSDERLVALVRRGNTSAFEVLVCRYESRLLAFCRHLLGSREDAEDVLQEVLAAAFNALQSDDRAINVRPWLYRICRNRSLNHLRRSQPVGVDSMDIHLSDNGASTADKVHEREEFRLLVGDINNLPETQKTALVLREMDALSYEQISEAMETTVPSVKSLLVRARVSLAEAAEARLLSCEEVRIELGEIAEGLRRRPSTLVRRHLRACSRCEAFQSHLKHTNRALAALLPLGPLAVLKRFALSHAGHSAAGGSGATAAGSGAGALGTGGAIGSSTAISSAGGIISASVGTIATKAAAGLAVTALVTAGAVEVTHSSRAHAHHATLAAVEREPAPLLPRSVRPAPARAARPQPVVARVNVTPTPISPPVVRHRVEHAKKELVAKRQLPATAPSKSKLAVSATDPKPVASTPAAKPVASTPAAKPLVTTPAPAPVPAAPPPPSLPGRTQSETDPTILTPSTSSTTPAQAAPAASQPETTTGNTADGTTTTTTTSATDTTTAAATTTSTETATGAGPGDSGPAPAPAPAP